MTYIYVAGPLFNTHERRYMEEVAQVLEHAGYRTFLPHRDAGIVDVSSPENRKKVFHTDLQAMQACDLCVAVLTGADHDSGTSAELGYFFALGKPCFGISDDLRWMNNLIWGLCGEGQHLVKQIEDVLPLIAATLKERSA